MLANLHVPAFHLLAGFQTMIYILPNIPEPLSRAICADLIIPFERFSLRESWILVERRQGGPVAPRSGVRPLRHSASAAQVPKADSVCQT
jgi:hypothetical protein